MYRILLPIVLVAAALSGCGGGDVAETAPVEQKAVAAPRTAPDDQLASLDSNASLRNQEAAQVQRGQRPQARTVRLPDLLRANAAPGNAVPGRLQIGVARNVAETRDSASTQQLLNWQSFVGSTAAALTFQVPKAAALRLGLLVRALPPDAILRGYVGNGDTLFEVPASRIVATLQANRAAGDTGDDANTWWSPIVDGEEVTLEIDLPSGTSPSAVDIALPKLSHIQLTTALLQASSSSCEINVACSSDTSVQEDSRTVARASFVSAGSSYLCTGTLLNNMRRDYTPYFLTANHCISTQTEASSLQTSWFYRSLTCSPTTVSTSTVTLTGGATLLYTSQNTDATLLRLNDAAPSGALFAGWSSSPQFGYSAVGIHHPGGDLQKYSVGTIVDYANCTVGSSNFSCTSGVAASASGSNFARVNWSQGLTEPGSSGSGLFASISGGRYVVGQLRGGDDTAAPSSCTPSGSAYYGRFDISYRSGIWQWINGSVWRFYDTWTGKHFYTMDLDERDRVLATMPQMSPEGAAFVARASTNPGPGSSPVYRFYNYVYDSHFYTIDPAERDRVIATMSATYRYEGVAWYAYTTNVSGTIPLYRFYNNVTAAHFFTTDPAERDRIANDPNNSFKYEFIAYYVYPAF